MRPATIPAEWVTEVIYVLHGRLMTLEDELLSAKSHYHQNMLLLEWYVYSLN